MPYGSKYLLRKYDWGMMTRGCLIVPSQKVARYIHRDILVDISMQFMQVISMGVSGS